MTEDSPYTDALADLAETRWRRDALPTSVCGCGHAWAEHRIDIKRQACDRGSCPCVAYRLRWFDWTERRVVREAAA